MVDVRRTVAGLVAAVLALGGCSAGDRALLSAPSCPESDAVPRPEPVRPGTVHAWRPHAGTDTATRPADGPVAVPGWTDVVSLASSGSTTYAAKADGTVWAYGLGAKGSLGDGVAERHVAVVPQPVPGITDARSVHVVGSAAFAVRADGTVLAWGDGLLARAGERGTVGRDVLSPIPLPGLDDVATIAPGALTAIALRADGSVAGWGTNLTDMLGGAEGTALTPVRDAPRASALAVTTGAVLAVTSAGTVCAWGDNSVGELAVQPVGGRSARPVGVPGPVGVTRVAGGTSTAYALDGAGAVWAWGRGASGSLGDGDGADHASPVPRVVVGLPPARYVAASGFTGFAVDVDGTLWGWGSRLALGDLAPDGGALVPVRVPLPGPVLAVAGTHALVDTG